MIPLHDDNPTRSRPVVTVAIIVACALAFLWQWSHGPEAQRAIIYAFGVIPATLFGERHLPPELALVPPGATVFTSLFLHGGWLHLLGNMLFLWIFGNNVEDAMGHGRFLAFYLICGTAAALAQALPDTGSVIPMVGASGSIAGVLGAYLLLFPHARILVLVPIGFILQVLRLPAVVVLGFWFLLQLISTLTAEPGQGGVAFAAHAGGFLTGLALVPLFRRRGVPLLAPPRDRRR
ncbi:rhomboid family intramembrane serine protease [Thioalbus denitrificans]|uniref:Membrane associated rhomboid family serine protease n=1 Tax=Thioalbus denitrificans TaxID=547122 RepID=A0A369CIJ9_9GAMM|nr:rhomboid family intramembrane serine protease [Thioalbus denitrificans]RCX33381.1 membrane associated rhomboid family serine protease [Thioalbus denitrificans]